jgi:hypothetical protein
MYAALKYDRPRAKLTYSDLCAHAPQTRHLDWENVRSQMNKIHRPHKQSGYIAKVDFQQTTDGGGRPDWIMLYMPGPKARAEFKAFTKRGGPTVLEIEPLDATPPIAASEATEVERELIQRGITPAVAAELVRDHAEEKIRSKMEHVAWQVKKKPGKIEDEAAYLVQAIKNDYPAPKGFVSEAERLRREEARKAKEHAAAEARRREKEQQERERAAEQEAEAHWKSLTPEQQAEIDAASMAQTDPADLALEKGHFGKTIQRNRRLRYVRQMLDSRETPPTEA